MALHLELNGKAREFEGLAPGDSLERLVAELELKGDRIAVERNGQIVSRSEWPGTLLDENDRLEVVHFVGGGGAQAAQPHETEYLLSDVNLS